MLPGDVKQTTSKCSRRSLSPPELSNFSPLIGFWSDSFDSSSEYGSSRKALKIFTGGRNVSSEIFCVVLPETNGCLTKCRLDLQPPWLGPPPPHTTPTPHPGRSHSHPHQKTKSINSTPSLLLSYVCVFMSMLLAFLPTDSVDFVKQTPSLSPRFGGCLQFAFLQMDHSSLP